jgi:hypothetical protein
MPAIKTAQIRVAGLLFLLPSNTVSTSFGDCPDKTRASYKIRRVVVARRMQHHAIRRRACLFVADTGVAHETAMVIDGSPPVGAVPDEFATGFAASLDFLEALLFRGQ